jgi:FixJ family two-component response regulator
MSERTPVVYVIDDDLSVRISLGRMLRAEGFHAETFESADAFLRLKAYRRPACVISDVQMPGTSGLKLQDLLRSQGVSIPIVFITGYGKVPMSVDAMKKGAIDFLPKPYGRDALLEAVNRATEQDLAGVRAEISLQRVYDQLRSLSHREKEVMEGVVEGLLNKQIAIKLGITEKTVKVHRANVMLKMRAESVPHLVRLAELVGIGAPVA